MKYFNSHLEKLEKDQNRLIPSRREKIKIKAKTRKQNTKCKLNEVKNWFFRKAYKITNFYLDELGEKGGDTNQQ
jgi:hypothetical protein